MYYIDFDNTLFKTQKYGITLISKLYEKVMQCITKDEEPFKIDIIKCQTIDYYFYKAYELSYKYNIPYTILEDAIKSELNDSEIKNKSNYIKILSCLYEKAIENISSKKNIEIKNENSKNSKTTNSSTSNFFWIAEDLALKYNIPYNTLKKEIRNIMLNDSKFIYEDAKIYLQKLRKSGDRICILTYVSGQENFVQQSYKLAGSEILNLVDEIYITTMLKYRLGLNYETSTCIDDSPRDLKGLYYRQHPELAQSDKDKEEFKDYEIKHIDSSILYNQQNFNDRVINNLVRLISVEKSISTGIINEYISKLKLDSINFSDLVDCLSSNFKIRKSSLENVVNSSYTGASNSLYHDNYQEFLNRFNQKTFKTIMSYNVQRQNISQQLLQLSYSGILSHANGVHITNLSSEEYNKQTEKISTSNLTSGNIYRIIKPDNEKRTSLPLDIPNEQDIQVFTSFEDIPINPKTKTLDNN